MASHEPLRSRARSLFHWLSSRRHEVSRALRFEPESKLVAALEQAGREQAAQGCEDDQCEVPATTRDRPGIPW